LKLVIQYIKLQQITNTHLQGDKAQLMKALRFMIT
jgi:hypothetical protein